MKQLEERIKDRLEGYESSLPEGDFDEFGTLLDKSSGAGSKHIAAYLAWLTPAAVAAGLAIFFILRPTPEIEPIQVTDKDAMVAQTADPITVDDNADAIVVEAKLSAGRKVQNFYNQTADREKSRIHTNNENRSEVSSIEATTPEEKDADSKTIPRTSTSDGVSSPSVPATIKDNKKTVSVKVGSAAAGVFGSSVSEGLHRLHSGTD